MLIATFRTWLKYTMVMRRTFIKQTKTIPFTELCVFSSFSISLDNGFLYFFKTPMPYTFWKEQSERKAESPLCWWIENERWWALKRSFCAGQWIIDRFLEILSCKWQISFKQASWRFVNITNAFSGSIYVNAWERVRSPHFVLFFINLPNINCAIWKWQWSNILFKRYS